MAAYAALLSLDSVIEQTLSEIKDQVFFGLNDNDYDLVPLWHRNQLNSLRKKVIYSQKLFEEFPEKCIALESRITIIAYQLEDIIESSISGPPFMYFASEVDNLSRKQMCSAFVNFAREIDLIVEEVTKMKNNSKQSDNLVRYSSMTASSSSGARGGNDTMVGFNEDLNEILDRATGQDRSLQIIPIVGMGGIGKTTLARNVFEHQLIIEKFDVRFWITVSQDYNVQEILLELLSCKGQSEEDVESLIERLYKSLKGRKFLVVLDDMWHSEMWYKVKRAFPNCKNGSRIIITSRLLEMVREVNTSSVFHHMKFLNEEQSWSLFCEKVFGRERCPRELENIGKKIASNCKGLPLAIVVIGGLLKVKRTVDYWEEIARNVIELAASNDQLFGILSLSYANLPYHMKSCFLYMGVFPEDFRIPSSQLIQLLVSEGFIKPKGPKSMEEVAEEYLKNLASRNLVLFQQDRRFETLYSIHDILRELSMRKAKEEIFYLHCKHMDETNFQKIVKGQRRIIIHPNNFHFLPNSPIRSLLYFDPYFDSSLLKFTSNFKLLKMVYGLKVREEDISSPDSIIFELIHLKFLGMELLGSYVDDIYWAHLHESIVNLHNLRTLRIVGTCRVVLPWHIWRMPKLKHLDVSWSYISLLPGVSHYLQTLSGVRNFKFTMDVIQNFPYLKILKILYAYEVYRYDSEVSRMDWTKFCLNNLAHLHQLEELEFKFKKDFFDNKEHFPRNLAFPRNLKRLTLDNIRIPCERMSEIGNLLNLEVLVLYDCSTIGDNWEPNVGEFLGLKHLQLQRLHLEKWNTEEIHFPRLEELFLSECSFEIPSSVGDIPTLDKLTVDCCDNITIESARRIEEEQLNYGNDKLQIVIKMPSRKRLPKKKVERKRGNSTSSKDHGFKNWIKKVHRSICCSPPVDRDRLLWYKDLGQHCSGEFSMAVVQANTVIEDQSQLESGCLSSKNSGPYGTFVGVYDGHGGPETSEFINEHLFRHLKSFTAEHQSMSVEVIQKAFQATEDGFLSVVTRQWPMKPQIAAVGSCCLVGIICGGTLYVANVGESRAVLGRISVATGEVRAIQLSEEHLASNESVRQELRSLHPDDPNIVVLRHNIWRVKGIIHISRSIGDVYLKKAEFSREPLYPKFLLREPFRRPILSSEPSVTVHPLLPQDQFIIFASDGLWEQLSNQEAVDLVQHHPRNGSAKRLVRAALEEAAKKRDMKYSDLERIEGGVRRHFYDDITVVVVFLDSNIISRASSVQTPNVSIKGNGVILPPNSPDTYSIMETESVAS